MNAMRIAAISWALFLASAGVAAAACTETPEGVVCTITQPIVAGAFVSVETQRDLGLVTVNGGCSGTLVNRYWVLTADHCVTTNGAIGGPALDPARMRITAAWSPRVVTPTRTVRNWNAAGLDLALVYLGMGDFGTDRIQLISIFPAEDGHTVVKYGRGISAFAVPAIPGVGGAPGTPAQPAVSDGQYRTATFTVSSAGAATYTVMPPTGAAVPIPDGGDSGGPDVLLSPNGVGLGVTGVQSTCVATGTVPPQPLNVPPNCALNVPPNCAINWPWVTGISSCNSAPISEDTRYDMIQIMYEKPAPAIGGALHEIAADDPDDLTRISIDISGALYELQ